MKRVSAALSFVLLLAACGDAGLLDGLGDRSREVVYASTTTQTILPIDDDGGGGPLGGIRSDRIGWYNDTIENQSVGEPSFTIARVWNRGKDSGRFIQASRAEIAAALPGLEFPGVVPDVVNSVTSQLVYDVASATLDLETSAAFGLWQVEPYSADEGRVAVLRVGQVQAASGSAEILADQVSDGLSLSWVLGPYRYELFCRSTLPEEQCWQMAETALPLESLLGDGVT